MTSTLSAPSHVRFALCALAFPALAALAACASDADLPGAETDIAEHAAPLASTTRLRLMGANITSGNNQSYDPGEGKRIFQGIKPDVVMIQEFNFGTNSAADIRSFVDTAFGTTFSYFREAGAQIPNGIISRYPILASGDWVDNSVSNRDFVWARIDIPGPVDLWAVSVHLLTSSASARSTEASQLVSLIKQNIPASDFLVIGGDFNTSSRSEGCISTFSQVVTTAGPYPADRNGNSNTNASRGNPYDWVLVDADLSAYKTPVLIGASSFASGLVADTRSYSPIAEISPALVSDSSSTNMQHMGIVRDFLIPGDVARAVTVTAPNGGESFLTGSAQTITWSESGISNVKLEYTTSGTSWSLITGSTPAAAGSFPWTVPSVVTSAARVRVSDAADATMVDTSDGAFTITTPPSGAPKVFVIEILAIEPGSDTASEFVEIVNAGTAAADLGGYTLSDAVSVRHTFATGTSLGAGRAIVVFAGTSSLASGLGNAVTATSGSLGLSNSGDTVTLKDAVGAIVDTFTFDASLSSTDGVSMNRSPDGSATGAFQLHTSLSSRSYSPGQRVNGSAF